MAQTYELIVFDWDGTLIDSIQRIVDCFQLSFGDTGLPEPAPEAIRQLIGLPLADAFRHLAGQTEAATLTHLAKAYRRFWLSDRFPTSPLFPGVEGMLTQLQAQGFVLAIATGKSRVGLDRELNHHGLHGYFPQTRCAEETRPKPHPEMLHQLMRHHSMKPERTLMVGDTTMDLDMARQAGVDAVAVSSGSHPAEQLRTSKPLEILSTVTCLLDVL